jgi:hypothetical protein
VTCYILAAMFDVISFLGGFRTKRAPIRPRFLYGEHLRHDRWATALATVTTGFWDSWKGVARSSIGPLGRATHTQVWRTINTHMTIMLTVRAIVLVDVVIRLVQLNVQYATVGVKIFPRRRGASGDRCDVRWLARVRLPVQPREAGGKLGLG